jgi:hypothetical protein
MQRARDLWWIVLFVFILACTWFVVQFTHVFDFVRDRSGLPERIWSLPDCGQSNDDAYAGPFSAHDCIVGEYYNRTYHVRFSPADADRGGEVAVDYYNGEGGIHSNALLERHLTAYDYPVHVRNAGLWFVPVSRSHHAQIAVWKWGPQQAMIHIGDLPYGAVVQVHEDYFAVTADSTPGPWRATLFRVADGIELIGTFNVAGERYENCRASDVSDAVVRTGLVADQLKICDLLHANDQGPRAYRDRVTVEAER